MKDYDLQSTGEQQEFSTGAVRDRQLGKGRFDLLPAIAMLRIARHFEKGAVKYGDRNWEKGIPLSRYLDSALRHAFSFLEGKKDEDHLVAATWNLLAALETEARAGSGRLPADLVDIGPEIDHEEGNTKMIYLASPYTHPDPAVREQRFLAACQATAALIHAGHVVFSPIVHSHPLSGHGLPTTWAFWRQQDQAYLERCDEVVVLMLDGWRESAGVQGEIQLADELGKPVRFWEPGEDVASTGGAVVFGHARPRRLGYAAGLAVPHVAHVGARPAAPGWPRRLPTTRGPAWGPRGRPVGQRRRVTPGQWRRTCRVRPS